MSNRSVKFVPALFAGVVAGTSLATVTDLRAQTTQAATDSAAPIVLAATDTCLSAPKGDTPSGGHWYYRIDRATKRQCWYLREESDKADDKFARAAPPAPAPSPAAAEPAPPQTRSITSKSIADARAEYISQQGRAARNSTANAEPQTTGTVPAAAVQDGPRAAMPNVLAPTPLERMRWNEGSGANSQANSQANPASLQTIAAAPSADQPAPAEAVQQPAAADPVAPAATEPVPPKPKASLQMLLLVMAAALALAGLTVSAIVRIGRIRARRAMRRKRRAMWDSARTKRSPQPMFHDEDARLRRTAAAHNPRGPQDRARVPQERTRVPQERTRVPQERAHVPHERTRVPQERARAPQDRDQQVTEMLARLARSAQN